MAHHPTFQTECKITIDGISYEGEVIDYDCNEKTVNFGEKNFTNNNRNENNQKVNEMNDILKNLFHL